MPFYQGGSASLFYFREGQGHPFFSFMTGLAIIKISSSKSHSFNLWGSIQLPSMVVATVGILYPLIPAAREPELVQALILIDTMYYQIAEAHAGFIKALAGGAHRVLGSSFVTKSATEDTPGRLKTWHHMRLYGTPKWVFPQVAYQRNVVLADGLEWEVAWNDLSRRICPWLVSLKDSTDLDKEKAWILASRARTGSIRGVVGDWLEQIRPRQ
ncbi:hypothetical protein BJ170DRAFT_271940 [Xylariales sp. AK1849]|nr:hypothetical protein BJ170DRAFT_271940 [Xylariales sp. AK1849]